MTFEMTLRFALAIVLLALALFYKEKAHYEYPESYSSSD